MNANTLDQQTQIHQVQCIFGSVSIEGNSSFHSQDSVLYSVYSSVIFNKATVYDLFVRKSPVTIVESTASISSVVVWNVSASDSAIAFISVSYSTLSTINIAYSLSNTILFDLMFVTGSLSNVSAHHLDNIMSVINMRTSTISLFEHSVFRNANCADENGCIILMLSSISAMHNVSISNVNNTGLNIQSSNIDLISSLNITQAGLGSKIFDSNITSIRDSLILH